MGVQTRILTHAGSREAAATGAARAFERIAALEQAMSDYRPDSELSRLCKSAEAGEHDWQHVSPDLFRALALSQTLASRTDGAFSATIGPAVALWREARRSGELPDAAELARAVELSDWRSLEVDREARRVRLLKPGMRLDLGGIGKGYAAQAALESLIDDGLPRSLVALGGDVAVGHPPPGGEGWRIALRPGLGDLLLASAAISTSGDIEQFVNIDGKRYSHIVDPRTGLGIVGGPWVTVVASRGEYADALATAGAVLGLDDAETLILEANAAAIVVERGADGRTTTTTIDPRGLLRWHAPSRGGTVQDFTPRTP